MQGVVLKEFPTRVLGFAAAKVNLTLRVLGRRPDGYHRLESLLCPVSLFDELEFVIGAEQGLVVATDSADAPGGPGNLVHRAALAFFARIGQPPALQVAVRKRIPVGSGLGGGSSDAACVLRILNRAYGNPLPLSGLRELALPLGADVPALLAASSVWVEGMGERVTPVSLRVPLALVLCRGGGGLSTAEVFGVARRALTLSPARGNVRGFLDGKCPVADILQNDLETPATMLQPAITEVRRALLRAGAIANSMTGSGSAVFGVCRDAADAIRVTNQLRREGLWAEPVGAW